MPSTWGPDTKVSAPGVQVRGGRKIFMRLSSVNFVSKSGSFGAGTTANAATSARSPAAAMVVSHRRATTVTDSPALEVAEAMAEFESVRPRLFGIAYRMLGGVADAEDIVQDVWVRWQGADRARVRDRVAFLVTITTRVALNAVTSARTRREVSVSPWLPEPVLTSDDPTLGAERAGPRRFLRKIVSGVGNLVMHSRSGKMRRGRSTVGCRKVAIGEAVQRNSGNPDDGQLGKLAFELLVIGRAKCEAEAMAVGVDDDVDKVGLRS
jgi:hypothetical protein